MLVSPVIAQDISIFFLKDGSIVQGTVVNENQNRIFLKTEQGTIKILTMDILGREDLARKGDLSFISERVDHLQNHVNHLTGKLENLNDSLRMVLDNLSINYQELEGLQGEFEIDLLRLHSQGREQKKQIQYLQDDGLDKRVDIAANRQNLGGLKDTVNFYVGEFKKESQTLETTTNTAFLLTGTVSNTRRELQDAVQEQQNQKNQIDIMAGSIAHLIQEVQQVSDSFAAIEEAIEMNGKSIAALTAALQTQDATLNEKIDQAVAVLNQEIDQAVREYTSQIKLVQVTLEDQADQGVRTRKKIDLDIKDLGELSDRKHEKLAKRLDDLEKNFFTVESNIDSHLASIKKSIDRLNSELKTVKKSISEKK
jgi:chromosome segregation ATPase